MNAPQSSKWKRCPVVAARCWAVCVALFLADGLTRDAVAEDNPVRAAMLPISLDHGRLAGEGGSALLAAARESQFVLIGEEHGIAESAHIATALVQALRPEGLRYLLAEIGPIAARDVERLARAGDDERWNEFYRRAPFSVPFFWFAEDIALAETLAADNDAGPVIWGVDQEFVLSPALHLTALADAAQGETSRARIETLLAAEFDALAQLVAERNPETAPLLMFSGPAVFEELRQLLDGNADALTRVGALAESHSIYALFNQGRGFENNARRAQLMKRLFAEYLRASEEGPAQARVLGKVGANHAQRGLSATHVLDIGNHLAELAAWNGTRSLHVLIVPVGGAKNMVLPFSGPEAGAVPVRCDDLGPFVPLCHAAGSIEGWQYADLAALRTRLGEVRALDPELVDIVLGFDAAVFLDRATPATMVPGNLEVFSTVR